MLDIRRSELSNGLKVVTIPMPGTQTVTVMMIVKAGSRYEAPEENGIAHFLEHMLFKGGKKYPSAKATGEVIDGVGGDFNAFTGQETAAYYIKVAKPQVKLAFDVLSDMLLHSRLPVGEIRKEKGVILEEYHMYLDSPSRLVGDVFDSITYPDHPLGRRIIGTPATIHSMTRGKLQKFMRDHYRADNMVLAVAGACSHSDSLELARKYFTFPKRESQVPEFEPARESVKLTVKVVPKATDQAHFVLGMPAVSTLDPRKYPLKVAAAVLGGSMTSRLFTAVRERLGLAYYIGASGQVMLDTGYFSVAAGVKKAEIGKVISIVKKELKKLARLRMDERELSKTKQLLKGRLLMAIEDSEHVAYTYASQELLLGRIEDPEAVMRKIEKISARDVRDLMKDIYSPERLHLAVIGPYKKEMEKEFIEILRD